MQERTAEHRLTTGANLGYADCLVVVFLRGRACVTCDDEDHVTNYHDRIERSTPSLSGERVYQQ